MKVFAVSAISFYLSLDVQICLKIWTSRLYCLQTLVKQNKQKNAKPKTSTELRMVSLCPCVISTFNLKMASHRAAFMPSWLLTPGIVFCNDFGGGQWETLFYYQSFQQTLWIPESPQQFSGLGMLHQGLILILSRHCNSPNWSCHKVCIHCEMKWAGITTLYDVLSDIPAQIL